MLNADFTALVPLIEPATGSQTNDVESPMWGVGAGFESETGQSPVVLQAGLGGSFMSQISKGTAPYIACLAHVSTIKSLVGQRGIEVVAVLLVNGESDAVEGTEAGYSAEIIQFQSDYDADLRAITGQIHPVPVVLAQNGNLFCYGVEPTSARVQETLARMYPDRFVLGAVGYVDVNAGPADVHLCNRSSRRRGELLGSAAGRRYLRTHGIDVKDRGFRVGSVARSGSVVRVTLDAPLNTMFDTKQVDYKEHYGFEWYDAGDGNSVSIVSVELIAPNVAELRLSNTPTGTNQRVRYAYSGVAGGNPGPHEAGSARGNWRSVKCQPSAANDSGDDATIGRQLVDWCPLFDLPVSTVLGFSETTQIVVSSAASVNVDCPIDVPENRGVKIRINGKTINSQGPAWYVLRANGATVTVVKGSRTSSAASAAWTGWLAVFATGNLANGADVIIGPSIGGYRSVRFDYWSTVSDDQNGHTVGVIQAGALTSVGCGYFNGTSPYCDAGTKIEARLI